MAVRIPLVIVAGEIEQLQAGDSINVPITGAIDVVLTNDEAGPVVICAPVYMDAADGFKKAKADASLTAICVGIVNQAPSIGAGVAGIVAIEGVVTATTGQWDAVTGAVGGLTFGVRYYLDPTTSGKITSTAPTTVGQYVVELGVGISTTELKLHISKRILL